MAISFIDYLFEDLSIDITALQAQVADLQMQKAKKDKVIDDQLRRLNTMLLLKQKQLAQQDKQSATQQGQQNQQQNQQQNPQQGQPQQPGQPAPQPSQPQPGV